MVRNSFTAHQKRQRQQAAGRPDEDFLLEIFNYYSPLKRLAKYVSENPTKPLNMAEAAAIAGLESTYFCRFFHKKTGISFKWWNDTRIIELAATRLRQSDDSVSQIADEFGFDLTTFERTFRRIREITPKAYRIAHQPGVTSIAKKRRGTNKNRRKLIKNRRDFL